MNIFEKRPLALILCIGLGGFFLFTFDSTFLRIILIISAVLPCILSFILKFDKSRQLLLRVISAVLLLSFLLSFIYFDLTFKLYNVYDEEVEIIGVVDDISESSSYTLRLTINVESINGKKTPGRRVYAYPTKTEAAGIIENTRISFRTTFGGFSDESTSYNLSNGINAYANDISNIKIIEYTSGDLSGRIERLREYLTRYIITLSDADSGALLSALLLGERDYLPNQLQLDFRRIGISHILALSGMHLAILSLGIGKLLSLFGIKKKLRLVIISVFVFLYMTLTGFSVSVVRAGVMLIISSVLFLLSRTKDSLTSLTLAVTVICVATPYAVFDISLWLSALATFGIIALSEYTGKAEKPKTRSKKIISYLIFGILTSIFAISATIAISTYSFGGFSILAPIATLIFSILAELIMYLGCVMAIFGWLIPIGALLSPLCQLVYYLAGLMSSAKFAYISSNFTFVTALIIAYTVSFFLFIILKLKKPKKAMKLILIFFAAIMIIPTAATVRENYKETVAYSGGYKSDLMLVRSKNEVCLINSAQYSKNLVYDALDLLEDANATYLDKYYLTHYSWSLDDDIETLLKNVSVREVYLPYPRNDDEDTILKLIYKSVENSNAEVVIYQEYETVTVGDYSINLLYSAPYGETSMNAFSVCKRDTVYLYLSSGLLASKEAEQLRKYASLSDYIILGDHGKKYKDKTYLEECYEDLDGLVIHSENIFLKQHNMQYYIDNGCGIWSHPEEIIYFLLE